MQAAGITRVRIAEFAWHTFQPSVDASFNFTLFDAAIAVLGQYGIKAIVGTPTAAPPAWLIQGDPTMQLVDSNGNLVRFGSRQDVNHLNPLFLSATRDIVSALAAHYADAPGVAGFQVDNEIHGENDYGPTTLAGFQAWLETKYVNLDALNARWGTVFWGQEYDSFDTIPLPWNTLGAQHNPALALDYARFIADVGASYLELQARLLRAAAPSKAVTHNMMGTYNKVDYGRFGASLDIAAWDNYPFGLVDNTQASESRVYGTYLQHAFMRATKAGAPYYVMEQQAANTGQTTYYGAGVIPVLRLGVWASVAEGADGVQFFRWRTTRWGTEQHWEGVLDWNGSTKTARYAGVQRLGAEFALASSAIFGSRVRARVAVLHSIETRWAFFEQPLTSPAFAVEPQMAALLGAFRANRLAVDVVHVPADTGRGPPAPVPDLSAYAVVLAPTLWVVPSELAAALDAFVRAGGRLLLTMRSGSKDADNAYPATALPGPLAGLAGVTIDEWDPLCSTSEAAVAVVGEGTNFSISTTQGRICEFLEPAAGTAVLATYAAGFFAGRAAVTRAASGAGAVVYAGTVSDDPAFYEWLAGGLARDAQLPWPGDAQGTPPRLPYGVTLSVRTGAAADNGTAVFLINYNDFAVNVTVPEAANGVDVITGARVAPGGALLVPALDVAVVAVPA